MTIKSFKIPLTTTRAFKVPCLNLTQTKKAWMIERIVEYARIYNMVAKLMPSLPEKKYLRDTNCSILYTRWVKEQLDNQQLIKSELLSGLQILNAIKDARANYLAMKSNGGHHSEMKPNIIKFENSEYDIVHINPANREEKDARYAIAVGDKNKETKLRSIVIPLITGRPKWGVVEHLQLGIQMQSAKKIRTKELSALRKEKGAKREKKVKAGLGAITYNLRDNTISIPRTTETPIKSKGSKRLIDTIIGVDLGKNNTAVISAIRIFPDTQTHVNKLLDMGIKDIYLNAIHADVMKVKVIRGFQTKSKMKQLRKMEDKRRKLCKDVGHRRSDLKEFTNHKVSRTITDFAAKYPNSVVIFEKGLAKLKDPTWSPADAKTKCEYKLGAIGIDTFDIHPAYTSQICNHCGAIGTRTKGTVYFSCSSCGLGVGSNPTSTIGQYNADVNASINIALRGLRILTQIGKTVGYIEGTVADPNKNPDDTARGVNTNRDLSEVVEGKVQNTCSCKDMKLVQIALVVMDETKTKAQANESRSISHGKRAKYKALTYGLNPPKARGLEKRFSSPYKGVDNYPERTESEQKSDIGEVLSQTMF